MQKYKLKVSNREDKTPNQLRREGQVPATLYGPAVESESIQLDAYEFSRLPAAAYSHLIDLEYGDGKTNSVIIRQVQRVSTTEKVLNVQFYRVKLDKKLTVTVPIKLIGTSKAVSEGAQLFEAALSVDVECFPADIPDYLEGDLSLLKSPDDIMHFSDLKVAEEVRILNPEDGVVCKAVAPKVASGAEAAEEEAAAEEGEATEGGEEAAAEAPAEG